jgi:DNA-binding transcriptional regulator YiaG
MKKTKLGSALIESMEEALNWHDGKMKLNTYEMDIPDAPPSLSKKDVKYIREKILKVSQPVLAKYLGVTDKAVKAWEQGLSKPSGSSARLLQIAQSNPKAFIKILGSLKAS